MKSPISFPCISNLYSLLPFLSLILFSFSNIYIPPSLYCAHCWWWVCMLWTVENKRGLLCSRLQGLMQEVSEDSASLSSCLCHQTHSPSLSFVQNLCFLLLHPLAVPACSLPVYLMLVSLWPSQPLGWTSHHLDPALTTWQKLLSQRSPETEMPDQWHFLKLPLPLPHCMIRHWYPFIPAVLFPVSVTPHAPSMGVLCTTSSGTSGAGGAWEWRWWESRMAGPSGKTGTRSSVHRDSRTSAKLSWLLWIFSLILWIVNSSGNVLCVCLRNKRKQVSD